MLLRQQTRLLTIRILVNLQNDGPVSVDYQSHDAEVIEAFPLLCLHLLKILIELYEQVTLEIQTNRAKVSETHKAESEAKDKKKSEYELPPELLE